jgi:hypothetical protein
MSQSFEQPIGMADHLSHLQSRLRCGPPLDREDAAMLCAAEGAAAIPDLVETLQRDPERSVRLAAATSLCRIGGTKADLDRLPEVSGDAELDLILRVVRARWRDGNASEVLSYRVESRDADQSMHAVGLIGTLLADESTLSQEAANLRELLARALTHSNGNVRSAATRALGRLDNKEAALLLKRHLSRLARRSNRGLVVAGCTTVVGAMVLIANADGLPLAPDQLSILFLAMLSGGVLMLLFGGITSTAQELRGTRGELEDALRVCADQSPENVALLRGELRRIASPLAAPYPGAQQQAWDLLSQVKNYEKAQSHLPIPAARTDEAVEELPLPAGPAEEALADDG